MSAISVLIFKAHPLRANLDRCLHSNFMVDRKI